MEQEKIKISIEDALKLTTWGAICEETNYNFYALREGLPKDTLIDLPISLVRSDQT